MVKSVKSSKQTARKSRLRSTVPASRLTTSVEARLLALEEAVAALGVAPHVEAQRATSLPPKFWAIDHIAQHGSEKGGVVFAGQVTLPAGETYAWQIQDGTNDLMAAEWSVANAPLAALAHPMRLTILKALLTGTRDTQSLQVLPDMGTTGQLYHHLKELESAGWIRQPRRGEYIVLAERVVPLLAIISACEVINK
ncbi:MAG: ArsR/SmtB family transcription factor [Casimicrobium sp.]